MTKCSKCKRAIAQGETYFRVGEVALCKKCRQRILTQRKNEIRKAKIALRNANGEAMRLALATEETSR